jgi:sugar lactone lactonase YvrE
MTPRTDPSSQASRTRRGWILLAVSLPIVSLCAWLIFPNWHSGDENQTTTIVAPPGTVKPKLTHDQAMQQAAASIRLAPVPVAITGTAPLIPSGQAAVPMIDGFAAPRTPAGITLATGGSFGYTALPPLISLRGLTPRSDPSNSGLPRDVQLEEARRFVMSLCVDQRGCLWVGCEEGKPGTGGVQRFDPSAPPLHQWTQFTTKDGLGDNNGYAVACDRENRIWVGHLNHGVSVYNGQKWQNYEVVGGLSRPDTLSGPLGERVFAIKCCPTDGDVWISTNCGLSRYSESKDTWSYYTRADGLPSDQSNAIAFDADGNIYLGTACDGIAFAKAADNYKTWGTVTGPDQAPLVPAGPGLPTSLINDVLVAHDGTVYAATTTGLAWSKDHGDTWQFLRGADWADKVRGLSAGPPTGWRPTPGAVLAEDYVNSLSQDARGYIWAGFRRKGAACFDPRTWQAVQVATGGQYVTSLLATDSGPVIGTYGDRLSAFPSIRPSKTDVASVALPSGAKTPTLSELNDELEVMATVPPAASDTSEAPIPLDDDWLTQGAWLGRYGRYWSVIAAICPPVLVTRYDYIWGSGTEPVSYVHRIGDHHDAGDSIRHWVSWLYGNDQRALEIPPVYLDALVTKGGADRSQDRRQAEWDDHGESYKLTTEWPDVYCGLTIPPGSFIVSLYEINNDAHGGPRNALRDFEISAYYGSGGDLRTAIGIGNGVSEARARVNNFFGGVYKRFLVRGPSNLAIKVARNHSFNATLSAVMLDEWDPRPAPYFKTADQSREDLAAKAQELESLRATWIGDRAAWMARFRPMDDPSSAGAALLAQLDELQDWNPRWWALNHREIAVELSRLCQASASAHVANESPRFVAACFYEARLYAASETAQMAIGERTARQIEKSLRWDHVSQISSGHGYELVTEYVQANPAESTDLSGAAHSQ